MILGTEGNERVSATANEKDESLARGRFDEACEFAGHVEAIAHLHLDMRKTEALWLMTSKSVAKPLDFDAKVLRLEKLRPLAVTLETKTRIICGKLTERSLPDDDWARTKLLTSLREGGKSVQ